MTSDVENLMSAADAMTADEVHDHPFAALDKIRGLTRELRAAIARLPADPAGDVREALIDVLFLSNLIEGYDWLGTGSSYPSGASMRREVGEVADVILARFTVVPRDADAEEWEYVVRHVAVDGWPSYREHESLAAAKADFATCGMNCEIMQRRHGGEWEPRLNHTNGGGDQ